MQTSVVVPRPPLPKRIIKSGISHRTVIQRAAYPSRMIRVGDMNGKVKVSCSVMSNSLQRHGLSVSLLCAATEIGARDTIMDEIEFLPSDFTI